MKNIKGLSLTLTALLFVALLAGCNVQDEAPEQDIAQTEKDIQADTEPKNVVDVVVDEELSQEKVVDIIVKGFNYHWNTQFDYYDAPDAFFELDGVTYLYLSPTYDTEEKMLAYLEEIYTEQVSKVLVQSYGYQVHDGRFYHEYAEAGTLYNWNHAIVEEIEGNNRQKLYQVKVPDGDFESVFEIELLNIPAKGWRLNTLIPY